ncbi:hypothetical protein HPGAM_04315 [Helicobacter pylori Gambia94/24]|nr:hypothetical protein HPGAM_04315 [Helicobacter pylori Gambia94/24]
MKDLFNCKKCFEYFLNKMKIIVLSASLKNKVKIF